MVTEMANGDVDEDNGEPFIASARVEWAPCGSLAL